ncbi:MAG: hypothetical protein AB1468_05250 [Candidatus Micrarchaeota archaeon]
MSRTRFVNSANGMQVVVVQNNRIVPATEKHIGNGTGLFNIKNISHDAVTGNRAELTEVRRSLVKEEVLTDSEYVSSNNGSHPSPNVPLGNRPKGGWL